MIRILPLIKVLVYQLCIIKLIVYQYLHLLAGTMFKY